MNYFRQEKSLRDHGICSRTGPGSAWRFVMIAPGYPVRCLESASRAPTASRMTTVRGLRRNRYPTDDDLPARTAPVRSRGRSSMAEPQPSKLVMRVRFPSPAPPGERHISRAFETRFPGVGPSTGQIMPGSASGRRGRAGRVRQRSSCHGLRWHAGRSSRREDWNDQAWP
jgi:hypothetical protein